MFKPVFGARQAGGPFVRAGLLMTLINVSCWELQEQGRAKGLFSLISLYFHLVHVAETTGVTQHWIPSSSWIFLVIPKLILVGMSLKPCVVLAGNVPVAVFCLCHW